MQQTSPVILSRCFLPRMDDSRMTATSSTWGNCGCVSDEPPSAEFSFACLHFHLVNFKDQDGTIFWNTLTHSHQDWRPVGSDEDFPSSACSCYMIWSVSDDVCEAVLRRSVISTHTTSIQRVAATLPNRVSSAVNMAPALKTHAREVVGSADNLQFSRFPSRRSTVHSTNGIVSSTQPLANEAGVRILKQGGNAAVCFMQPPSVPIFTNTCRMQQWQWQQRWMSRNQEILVSAEIASVSSTMRRRRKFGLSMARGDHQWKLPFWDVNQTFTVWIEFFSNRLTEPY